jgi:hypothetical protein
VREHITDPDFPPRSRRVVVQVAPPETATDGGIEVHEEELGKVTAQLLYKMRCECGRSWFELLLPKFVKCPACHKFGRVRTTGWSSAGDKEGKGSQARLGIPQA